MVLRFLRLTLCLAVLTVARPAPAPPPTLLTRAEFGDIRDICLEIERAAGGSPYHVVALGKSASPFLAFFRARNRTSARQLPLSNFQYGEGGRDALDESLVPKLFDHFDRYLPSDAEMEGKKLLVTDFAGTGDSARAFDRYFRRYLTERKRNLDYRFVAIHVGTVPTLPDGAVAVAATPKWLDYAFSAEKFDEFSPRGDFDVRRHDKPQAGSGRFEEMFDTVKAHLARPGGDDCLRTLEALP